MLKFNTIHNIAINTIKRDYDLTIEEAQSLALSNLDYFDNECKQISIIGIFAAIYWGERIIDSLRD